MVTDIDNKDLRDRRHFLRLSLDEVGQRLGVDNGTLSRFERGYRNDLPAYKDDPQASREAFERVLDEFARERGAA